MGEELKVSRSFLGDVLLGDVGLRGKGGGFLFGSALSKLQAPLASATNARAIKIDKEESTHDCEGKNVGPDTAVDPELLDLWELGMAYRL